MVLVPIVKPVDYDVLRTEEDDLASGLRELELAELVGPLQ